MTAQIDQLDTAAIEAMLPHSGNMSLLSGVVEFEAGRIVTKATSHTDPANPLRSGDRLPIAVGIEYAAQTVALHGALDGKDGGSPRRGYLAVLSNVSWYAERLDDAATPLLIEARQLVETENSAQFSFAVTAAGKTLLDGSFVVSLEPL